MMIVNWCFPPLCLPDWSQWALDGMRSSEGSSSPGSCAARSPQRQGRRQHQTFFTHRPGAALVRRSRLALRGQRVVGPMSEERLVSGASIAQDSFRFPLQGGVPMILDRVVSPARRCTLVSHPTKKSPCPDLPGRNLAISVQRFPNLLCAMQIILSSSSVHGSFRIEGSS